MTHTGTRTTAGTLAAVAVPSSLTGCGSDGGDGKSLTYWSMWTENEPQADVLKSAIRGFTKDTGIKVSVQWQGRTVLEKLAPTLTTGKVPDLVDHPTTSSTRRWCNQAAPRTSAVFDRPATGEKKPLAEALKMSCLNYLRKLPDGGGNRWLVPYEVTSVNLWYNAADKGVRAPKTWDELLKICARLKSQGRACIALGRLLRDEVERTGQLPGAGGRSVLPQLDGEHLQDPGVRRTGRLRTGVRADDGVAGDGGQAVRSGRPRPPAPSGRSCCRWPAPG